MPGSVRATGTTLLATDDATRQRARLLRFIAFCRRDEEHGGWSKSKFVRGSDVNAAFCQRCARRPQGDAKNASRDQESAMTPMADTMVDKRPAHEPSQDFET